MHDVRDILLSRPFFEPFLSPELPVDGHWFPPLPSMYMSAYHIDLYMLLFVLNLWYPSVVKEIQLLLLLYQQKTIISTLLSSHDIKR